MLTFSLGFNSTKRTPQWQARDSGVLYVPHYQGAMPTQNGESWECRRLDQIGSGGRSGSGVVVVWLVTRHEPQVAPMPMASATQLRKQGREEHRRRLAPAAYA